MADTSAPTQTDLTLLQSRSAKVALTGWRLSLAFMAVGLVWSLVEQEALPDRLATPSNIMGQLQDGRPGSLVALAILTIIATPVVTAAVMVWTCFEERDTRLAVISGVVLLILISTMVVAF